ncbi:MAG TPA: HAD family phosphatase, partial [Kiritimatiellia bacterium]|nr:HAD family phosphatase [Kiritimatiellia bacterium]
MAAGICVDMRVPAAIIFDFDGVIVDSERLHYETMVAALEGIGPETPSEYYHRHLIGFDDRGAFAHLLSRAGVEATPEAVQRLVARKAALFAEAAAAGGVAPLPGAVECVRACAAAGPVGICSGALRSDILPVLANLGIADCFAEMVTADDVAMSKPDPACYRMCLARLAARFPERGVRAGNCVAIEDTPDGIASARGAGLPVV